MIIVQKVDNSFNEMIESHDEVYTTGTEDTPIDPFPDDDKADNSGTIDCFECMHCEETQTPVSIELKQTPPGQPIETPKKVSLLCKILNLKHDCNEIIDLHCKTHNNHKIQIIDLTNSIASPMRILGLMNARRRRSSNRNFNHFASNTPFANFSFCAVCLEPFENQDKWSTICGHVYCAPCIRVCVKSTRSCPLCRKHTTVKNIHPLYF